MSGQTTVSDALENSLKRINLSPEWAAVFQLYYQDHDGVFCRFRKPDAIPDKNDIFLRLNLFSPVLLEILLEDKVFKKVRYERNYISVRLIVQIFILIN